jgi:hypothetical protein
MKNIKFSYEEVESAINNSSTIKEFLQNLGMKVNNGNYRLAGNIAKHYGLQLNKHDISDNGRLLMQVNKLPTEEFFVDGVSRNGISIRKRLINDLGYEDKCSIEECGQGPIWLGLPITLQVDHIDGDRFNNKLDNLRILCPNCHTQTKTFSNGQRITTYNYCECGVRISKNAVHCQKHVVQTVARVSKITYPPIPELVERVSTIGYAATGLELNISGNAIKKHLTKHLGKENIPKGMPSQVKPRPLSVGQEYLASAKLEDVIALIERDGWNISKFADSIPVGAPTLKAWLREGLGHDYVRSSRNQPVSHVRKVVYPSVEVILSEIANNGYENTATKIGVTSRAIDRHLKKSLPPESFPVTKSGILDKYRSTKDK